MAWGSDAWGSAAWAAYTGGVVAGETPGPVHGLGIELHISGIDRTDMLANDELRVTDDLENRNICEFTLIDRTRTYHPEVGSVVRLWHDNTLLFAGTIDEKTEQIAGQWSDALRISCICVDWNQLCDRHIVAAKFSAIGQTLGSVVALIVNTQSGDAGQRLSDEGITLNGVQTGPVLASISFNYQPCSECFDELAELTGYSWYVDYNKDLKFFDVSSYFSPHELDDAHWQFYRNLSSTKNREKYRNIQFLHAGKTTTNSRFEYFKGDGENKSFSLSMPVAETPTLAIDSGSGYVGVPAGDVSVRRDDTESLKEWFYAIDDKSISQNSDSDLYPALTATDTLRVTYQGFYPILDTARNDTQISYRAGIENYAGVATGVYTEVEEDESIDDAELAAERTHALLRKHGIIEDTVTFQTDAHGYRSGQRLIVNMPEISAQGNYLVMGVAFEYVDDALLRYDIVAVKGESQGNWADFYKRLARKGRPFTLREDDALHVLRSSISGIILGDTTSTVRPLESWAVDPATTWIIGQSNIGGRRDSAVEAADHDGNVFGPMIGLPYS